MKGILLAGGTGGRLHPITVATSKQLLPVYDKPLIYYPLSVLMLAGVRDILVICSPGSQEGIVSLLRDGSHLGLNIRYALQYEPRGIAEAYIIGAEHVEDDNSVLVLGDNIFHGSGFQEVLRSTQSRVDGCTLFGYQVTDPERYAIADVDRSGQIVSITEKPEQPYSTCAITGLYFYDSEVTEIAKDLTPSPRGELEITDVNQHYVKAGRAQLVELGRGFAWLDAGTPRSLVEAAQYVQILANRQGVRVACVEEIALRLGFITPDQCHELGRAMSQSEYGGYVMEVARAFAGQPG